MYPGKRKLRASRIGFFPRKGYQGKSYGVKIPRVEIVSKKKGGGPKSRMLSWKEMRIAMQGGRHKKASLLSPLMCKS